MSEAWLIVLGVGAGTILIKAAGPVVLGGTPLPDPVQRTVALLAPALLAALVATATLGGERELVLDARILGLGAAAVALVLRAPVLLVVALAAATAALGRLLGLG